MRVRAVSIVCARVQVRVCVCVASMGMVFSVLIHGCACVFTPVGCVACVCSCQASPVCITGATGPFASIVNGVFTPVPGEVYNGHPIFVNAGDPDKYLRYKPNHTWAVSSTEAKDANNNLGCTHSMEEHVALPQDVKRWKVGVGDKAVVQPDVRVATLTLQVHALCCVYSA